MTNDLWKIFMIFNIQHYRINLADIVPTMGWWKQGRLNTHWRKLTPTGMLLYNSFTNVKFCYKTYDSAGGPSHCVRWFDADICGHPFRIHQYGVKNIETNDTIEDKRLYKCLYMLYRRASHMIDHDLLPDRTKAFADTVNQYAKECNEEVYL